MTATDAVAGPDGSMALGAVPSPCNGVCRIAAQTRWCEGCLRTLDEIAAWPRMDDAGKRAVWALLDARRRGGAPCP